MTGVTSAPWRESFELDRFDIRYLKVKDSAEKFAVVQFGVCPFRWDSSKQSFIATQLRRNSREARDTPVVRIADFLFTERMKNRISEWRDGLLLNRIAISDSQRRLSRSLICGCCEVAKNEATQPQ
ncbi:hypothetical protein Vadar_028733 [Vaccinium darrowii]|uniref:Uncharacterized protein n=1 Tax=Vaccinium darrowii TaxID=229202 RepID=A0ACB7Z7U2_9ERIC|nr:hypothetical protein Vadar_028733 [Vaccinium darrowii]